MTTTREIALDLIEELPKLTGTGRKIAYAEYLRIKRIEADVIARANLIRRKRENRGEDAVSAMLEKTGAASEEEYIRKKIKADPMSAFNALKAITSAKDAIEYWHRHDGEPDESAEYVRLVIRWIIEA